MDSVFNLMADQQGADFVLRMKDTMKDVLDVPARLEIKSREGLVGKKDGRRNHQGASQTDKLLLTDTQFPWMACQGQRI